MLLGERELSDPLQSGLGQSVLRLGETDALDEIEDLLGLVTTCSESH